MPEPLLVEDANEEWWSRSQEYRDAVNAWLAREGIDVMDLKRVEAYLVDTPFAHLWFHMRDDDGRVRWSEEDEKPLLRAETVLLSSLPPKF